MQFKNSLAALAVIVICVSACVKDDLSESTGQGESSYPVLKAVIPPTRTSLDGSQLHFRTGDLISVFNGVVSDTDRHGHNLYRCTEVSEAGVATFEYMTERNTLPPSLDEDIIATYPNRSEETSRFEPDEDGYGAGTVKIRMVSGPIEVGKTGFNGVSLPIIAHAEAGQMLHFKHTCGALKLSLRGDGTIVKLVVESDKPISGEASVSYVAEAPELKVTGTGKSITYTYGDGLALTPQGTDFHIGLPAGLHSLKFTFHDSQGGTMTRVASGLHVERAEIRPTSLTYVPDENMVTDLSMFESHANCYMVCRPGTYTFDAKKPDGNAVEGVSATWVWASGEAFKPVDGITSDVTSMIGDIGLKDGKISFTVPSPMKYGSVVLGVLNSSAELEYTWHIWMTSNPKDITAAGITLMDRNLGAAFEFDPVNLNTSGELQGSRGCFYQWGRKDPVLGGRNTGNESTAFKSGDSQYHVMNKTVANVSAWSIGGDFGITQEAGSKYPVTLAASGKVPGYISTDKSTPWCERENANPCPYGYRVISSAEFTTLTDAADMVSRVNGNFAAVTLAGSVSFPRSGFRNANGQQQYVTTSARYYCNEVSASEANKGQYRKFDWSSGGTLTTTAGTYGSYFGCSVRCVRENVTSMPSMPSEEIGLNTKLKVAAYNIWTQNGRTGTSGATGEDADKLVWAKAYKAVAECVRQSDADVVGLNEVFKEAYSLVYSQNIQSLLPSYKWILYDENGDYVSSQYPIMNIYSLSEAILYNPDKVTLLDKGYFRVADPALDGVSVGGVDVSTEQRHVVWGKFSHKASAKEFYVLCLHNDTPKSYTDGDGNKVSDRRAQVYNSLATLSKAVEIVPEGVPSVILGDFNSTHGDEAFDIFRNDGRWKDAYETVALRDGCYLTSGKTITTMNGKDNSTLSTIRPDHIIADGFEVLSYGVDRNKYENTDGDMIFPSDHFLVKSILAF